VPTQQGYAQTFYKRLWWAGYRGRFAAFRWATTLDDGAFNHLGRENTSIFNSGEYRSWYGGLSLKNYVDSLHTEFPTVSVAAHSLGNACVGQALHRGMQVNSYVAMEAAVPLSCYYAESEHPPTDPSLVKADVAKPTPLYASKLGYQGYLSDIGNSVANRASYYNADDFWLVTGTLNHQIKDVNWMSSQRKYKPDDRHGFGQYNYDSQLGNPRRPGFISGPLYARLVDDPIEGMAFVSRSLTRPLGAIEPAKNKFKGLDLQTAYKFDRERSCHSGQFQRNIQLMYGNNDGKGWVDENGRSMPLYRRLMNDLNIAP
jgi:hypothetical protein